MTFFSIKAIRRLMMCAALISVCMPLLAQAPDAAQDELSVSAIQTKLDGLGSQPVSEEIRLELNQIYNAALDQLRAAEEWATATAQFEQTLKNAPAELDRLREALKAPAQAAVDIPEDASVAQVEGFLARAQSELAQATSRRAQYEEQTLQRGERRRQLPERLANARQRLSDVSAERVAAAGAVPELAEAKMLLANARSKAVQAEIDAIENELQSYDARGRLLTLQLDQAIRESASLERQVEAWKEAVQTRRQHEAVAAVEAASKALTEAEGASPHIRQIAQQLAQKNVALVNQGDVLAGTAQKTNDELAKVQQQLARVSAEFNRLSQKVDAVGHNNSLGLLLLKQREQLPNLAQHKRNLKVRQDEIAQVQMRQIELQDQRLALADIDGRLGLYMYAERHSASKTQLAKVEQILRNLLVMQRDTLDALLRDYDAHFEHLVDLDSAERQLIDQTRQFSGFIDERVLWIRSGVMLNLTQMGMAWNSLRQLTGLDGWAHVLRALWQELVLKFHPGLLLLGGIFLFLWLRPKVCSELVEISKSVQKANCTSFKPTLDCAAATVLLSLPVPAMVWFVGYRLSGGSSAEPFARAFGTGLRDMALLLAPMEIARQSLRQNGLFTSHFAWPSSPVASVRRHLPWLMVITGFTALVLALLSGQNEDQGRETLGRLLFMFNLIAITAFGHLLFHPRRGAVTVLQQLLFGARSRLHLPWYLVWTLTPLVFMLLAFMGYFYTTYRLSARLYETAILLFSLVVVRAVILRWLFLAKRRLLMKRPAAAAAADEGTAPPPPSEEDMARVNAQTYRLIATIAAISFLVGAWFIWTEELPALRILNTVTVLPSLEVTLADLITGLVIAALTFVATANVPGLLELTVLQRMHYMKGERYAITTIVRYAIAIIGFGVAFHNFGIGWSRIQWLVAALGVGLGFGLQEIFANFISGLIILFERPIRVGDIVTVGGISGTVMRIRTRATLILDFDRKELVVPNKEFITTQVVNWTLTDSVLRLTLKVGVAYGSKTEMVERLLYEVARDNPDVLDDPEPLVVFFGFGESALDFELRVFCGNADCMLSMRHALHMAIERRFREAGIEIAFPQREVHIRAVKDLLPAVSNEGKSIN